MTESKENGEMVQRDHLQKKSKLLRLKVSGDPVRESSSRSRNNSVIETTHISLEYDPVRKRKLLNTYEIIEDLGSGQHGKVKLALDIVSGDKVAIKILDRSGKAKLGGSGNVAKENELKIRKEIAIMKKCDHENVLKLLEVIDDRRLRKIYLVLEYVEKGEIIWESDSKPNISFRNSRKIFKDVVLGLEYLHFQGIIHRDIKPGNLLLTANNTVKISDFGVSFSLSIPEVSELDLCKSAGTPAFFAPELCSLGGHVGHKIDIWALGVTLYCLAYGRLPFRGKNDFDLFHNICDTEPEYMSYQDFKNLNVSGNEGLTKIEYDEMVDIIKCMLIKTPEQRIDIFDLKKHNYLLRSLEDTIETEKFYNNIFDAFDISLEEMGNAIKNSTVRHADSQLSLKSYSASSGASSRTPSQTPSRTPTYEKSIYLNGNATGSSFDTMDEVYEKPPLLKHLSLQDIHHKRTVSELSEDAKFKFMDNINESKFKALSGDAGESGSSDAGWNPNFSWFKDMGSPNIFGLGSNISKSSSENDSKLGTYNLNKSVQSEVITDQSNGRFDDSVEKNDLSVSLPVNSSYASLDSIDNDYLTTLAGSERMVGYTTPGYERFKDSSYFEFADFESKKKNNVASVTTIKSSDKNSDCGIVNFDASYYRDGTSGFFVGSDESDSENDLELVNSIATVPNSLILNSEGSSLYKAVPTGMIEGYTPKANSASKKKKSTFIFDSSDESEEESDAESFSSFTRKTDLLKQKLGYAGKFQI